jgi:hypothetical protein
MNLSTLNIRNHKIPCEIYESELKLSRRDKNLITLIAFVFKALPSPLLDETAALLWAEVARKYLNLKREFSKKPHNEVIGRISFEYGRTRIEYEFSRFTKSVLLNLVRIGQFVKQYPDSEEIRISRDGPILVRFRNTDAENTAQACQGKENRSKIQSWLADLGAGLTRFKSRKH